jgi:hypothetical protein
MVLVELGQNLPSSFNSMPYSLPLNGGELYPISLRFRVFYERAMVVSIRLLQSLEATPEELIELSKLSSHPSLEALVRLSFNAHYCPDPSQWSVDGLLSKPFVRLYSHVEVQDMIDLVSRHPGMNDRASREMLDKNEALNMNDDLLLIDKQGVVFSCISSDKVGQRNRFGRVEMLYEYAMQLSTLSSQDSSKSGNAQWRRTNFELHQQEVLSQSVNARRAWNLVCTKLDLGSLTNVRDKIDESGVVESPVSKKWYEGLVGMIVIGVVITILGAIAVKKLGLS